MEPIDDPQLSKLLREWKVEDAPPSLDNRVPGLRRSWWRVLMGPSVRVPLPVALIFAALFLAMGAALLRPLPRPATPTVSSTINLADFHPVEDVQVRIVRGQP